MTAWLFRYSSNVLQAFRSTQDTGSNRIVLETEKVGLSDGSNFQDT